METTDEVEEEPEDIFGVNPGQASFSGQNDPSGSGSSDIDEDGATTAAPTRMHSRHTSQVMPLAGSVPGAGSGAGASSSEPLRALLEAEITQKTSDEVEVGAAL